VCWCFHLWLIRIKLSFYLSLSLSRISSFRNIKICWIMCGSNVIISYFTLFFSRIKCFQTVYVKNYIITIFYMTIERNAIYKTAKLSLFCKVIDFRTNDYDLSTVAYKFIIKTQPFFLLRWTIWYTECQSTHHLFHTCTSSWLFFYLQPWFVPHTFLLRWFYPELDAICALKAYILFNPLPLYCSTNFDVTHIFI